MQTLQKLQQEALLKRKYTDLEEFCASQMYESLDYVERNRGFITASKLKEFARCQFCYNCKYNLELPDPYQDKEALTVGSALDYVLTYGKEAFDKRYEVVARRGESEKIQLTNGMGKAVENMVKEFRAQSSFNQSPKKKIVITQIQDFLLKVELDDVDIEKKLMLDIKSCANILTFSPVDYLLQMGFYSYVLFEATGEECGALLEFVDKHSEFSRSQGVMFTENTLRAQRGTLLSLLESYIIAEKTGMYVPASDQRVLFNCPYYGVDSHGRPKEFIIL